MLTLLVKLFNALNSENSTRQIALAISLGFMVGLTPLLTLQNLIILFFVLLIRVHLGSFILAMGFFSGLSYLLSSQIIKVGEFLLNNPNLNEIFTSLYQIDLFKLAHLHHTYVLGALVLGSIIAIPLYFVSNYLIQKYRVHIKAFFEQLRIVKALKASKLYRVYSEMSESGLLSSGDKV